VSRLSTRLLLLLLLGLGLLARPARAQSHAWSKKTSNTAGKTAVVSDELGYSFVLTDFTDKATVGAQTFISRGKSDVLLIKYGPDGQVMWARHIGGTEEDKAGDLDLVVQKGALFLTGSFESALKFSNQQAVTVATLFSAGLSDVFVAKYDAFGGLKWARRAGGPGNDYGNGIDATNAEDVYLTGSFTGKMSFTIPGINLTFSISSSGSTDAFLLRCNAVGTFMFARKLGGTGFDFGTAVAHDRINGDVYLTGGYAPATNPMMSNLLVARYDASGTLLQQKTYGAGANLDTGNDIVVGDNGAFVTGYFGGTINFDGKTLTSKGGADAFVLRYPRAAALNVDWAKQFGGSHWDEGHSLALRLGQLYVGGSFRGTATFGATTLSTQGGTSDTDLFLAGLYTTYGSPQWAHRMGSAGLDYGRGGMALLGDHTIFFTGHYGDAITLGKNTLSGSGNLLTRINLPTITDFSLINADTDKVVGELLPGATINYLALGTDKINIRANVVPGSVGSVKFNLDGVTKIENASPYTWAGDKATPNGPDYLGFTPSLGTHNIEVTPYAGPNGTGAAGTSRFYTFTIVSKFQLVDLMLVNADTDQDMFILPGVVTLYYHEMSTNKFNVRAITAPAKVGSVKFVLDGVARVENAAPYTLAGDGPKPDGSTDYKPITFSPGSHVLKVTAYSGPDATGTPSNTIEQTIHISLDGRRVAADQSGLESEFAQLTAAPNPSTGRTTLSFTATEDGPAAVAVYNSQGVAVARLFEGNLQKGQTYGWQFDGTAQPAGLYVARLKVGHRVLHQRLVLSR
jgi:hypothetical protein